MSSKERRFLVSDMDIPSALPTLLTTSIENNFHGFFLHYQPQLCPDSGRLYGAEALARWSCAGYGNVAPDVFIPMLEETGRIVEFEKWVFREAASQCKRWAARRPDFRMSVNLSCRHLEQADLGRYAQDELKRLGLAPSNMMFELTESWPLLPGAPCQSGKAASGRKEAAAGGAVVSSLKETGIRLAMDDFGSGYSSLLSLQKFPFDLVKIDREFVKGTARGGAQAAFVPSLTRLCHSVGCQVCLEGVETAEEYEAVRRLGIEVMQGYYFGRPVPAEEFERLYL